MIQDIDYVRSKTLTDSLEFLERNGKKTVKLAGGTDVINALREDSVRASHLLDLSRLEELKGIDLWDNYLRIGAGVTIAEIFDSDLVRQYAPTLQKAATRFASQQIRNAATIGGNVANASPCADTLPPLLIHEAQAIVENSSGTRRVPVEDIALGPYKNNLQPHDVITSFLLAPYNATSADFQKVGRRKELSIARANMAVTMDKSASGKIDSLRIALGSCTPTPRRFFEVEKQLENVVPDEQCVLDTARLMSEKMVEITGRRPSTVYKEKAVQGLFLRIMAPMVDLYDQSL